MAETIVKTTSICDAENSIANNAPNRRIGVCKDCGYQWYGRSIKAFKPSRCPECRARNCAWMDELTEEELTRLAPKLHGLNDAKKPDEQRNLTLKEVKPSSPPAKANKARASTRAAEPETRDEPEPATIDIPGVAENVPLIPQPVDEDSETAPVIAWENRRGEIEYAALVDPVTLDELDNLKAQAEEQQDTQPPITLQDIDILKAAGLIDNADYDEEEEEDEEELNETEALTIAEEDEEKTPAPKPKQTARGLSWKGFFVTVGILGAVTAGVYILPIIAANKKRKAAAQTNALPRAIEELKNKEEGDHIPLRPQTNGGFLQYPFYDNIGIQAPLPGRY